MSDPTKPNAIESISHLLVVDDDDRIRELLKKYLADNGYRVSVAANAREARTIMGYVEFDLLILDVMMPGETGFELTKRIRAVSNIPILLLTARGLPEDRIEGLERGADDYLLKPFEPRELLLRVASLLRRSQQAEPLSQELSFGECTFSTTRGELRRADEYVKLTAGEVTLLRALARKPGEAISRSALAEQTGTTLERSVDVQVTRLRKKIEADPRTPVFLQTVRGVGYALFPD